MKRHEIRRGDEFAVLISLAVAFGMLVGAVATVWMWTVMTDRAGMDISVSNTSP